jgi:putative transposase
LLGPAKWELFYLYVVIDIYSRYVPDWMLARAERAKLAEALLAEAIANQGIEPGQLTIHADRGTSMASKPVAFLLADLGVTKSHNRPHCSNDNPYSESHFRTLKYRPSFPARFGSFEDAHSFCRRFFSWYNGSHRHSGIGFHTPADVHYGRAQYVQAQWGLVLDATYAAHLERFVRKAPTPPALPTTVWIKQAGRGNDQTVFPRRSCLIKLDTPPALRVPEMVVPATREHKVRGPRTPRPQANCSDGLRPPPAPVEPGGGEARALRTTRAAQRAGLMRTVEPESQNG